MAKKPGGGKAVVKKNKGPNVESQARRMKSVDEIMGIGDLAIGEIRNCSDVEEIKTPDESLKEFIVDSAIKRTFSDWLTVITKKKYDRADWEGNAAQSSRDFGEAGTQSQFMSSSV
ncbi:hypothetical protein BVRB_6g140180 [Beta vulgaris subsp. vulgaris]|uniref:Uncharacterized protein n=1 Tax=Beta vulgaris subsp. vulgaris TaxID=3555 RepID=A0A0J8C4I2_BETVV|nr:hypothetical protein BVRB_6g140180 [Beta vulgaris subsp. vulgaris]